MSRRHFSWLLAVTVVVAVLVLLVPGRTGHESSVEKSLLLPGLAEQVNQLEWLRVSGAGGEVIVTLTRDDEYWRVEEAHGYPADWARLRPLLADLARAEVVERKTDNPEYYARLGVEDVDLPDAGGVMLEFDSASGMPALIVGNPAQGREGQYARLRGAAASVLVSSALDLPQERVNWLDRDIVDIADAEVVEVEIRHPDGERIVAGKISADDENFELQGIPEGRAIRSAWTVNSLANALSALTFDEVAPDAEFAWSSAVRFGLVTADGLRLDVELTAIRRDDAADPAAETPEAAAEPVAAAQDWIRLTAGLYQTSADREPPSEEAVSEATERAAALNRKLSGWAFRVPTYKAGAMNKRMEDLLQAENDAEN